MTKRVQKVKETPTKQEKAVENVEVVVDEEAEKLKAESDALLDEIDAELAESESLWAAIDEAMGENLENAQAFIDGFVQKGGQ